MRRRPAWRRPARGWRRIFPAVRSRQRRRPDKPEPGCSPRTARADARKTGRPARAYRPRAPTRRRPAEVEQDDRVGAAARPEEVTRATARPASPGGCQNRNPHRPRPSASPCRYPGSETRHRAGWLRRRPPPLGPPPRQRDCARPSMAPTQAINSASSPTADASCRVGRPAPVRQAARHSRASRRVPRCPGRRWNSNERQDSGRLSRASGYQVADANHRHRRAITDA